MLKGFWGEEMEHFTTEKWIDFVNQVVATSEKEPGRGHQREIADGETPGARLQTLHANSLHVAKGSSIRRRGRELPASRE